MAALQIPHKRKEFLVIEHINSQSLLSSINEITLLLKEQSIDILCISETWLLPHTPDNFVSIPHYNLFRKDSGRGGGVCIYVKESLRVNTLSLNLPIQSDIEAISQSDIEDIFLSVQFENHPAIIIGCMYRHPKANITSFDYINNILQSLCISKKSFFVLGDLNDNMLLPGNNLNKIFSNNKLTQIIDKPTRITSTSSTLLDVIITNNPSIIISHDVIPTTISDHERISVKVNIIKPRRNRIVKTFRHLGNYSVDNFCSLLINKSEQFDNILRTDDVETQVKIFNETFTECLDNVAPYITKEIRRPFAPWFNDHVHQTIINKNNVRTYLKKDRHNVQLQNEFKDQKKLVKSCITTAKKEYYLKQFNENRGNIKGTWNIIKEIIPNKKRSNVNKFDNTIEKANEFNNFFANVGKNTFNNAQEMLNNLNLPQHQIPDGYDDFQFRPEPVDVNTIILVIKHLNNTRSTGVDNISLKYIRDGLFSIAYYITCIINTSLVTGIVPTVWKHALVIPLHKEGDVNDVNNYRPISKLPILSKVLEKIVTMQLVNYLESNNLLSNSQHGFRPRLSTETALSTITDTIYNNMDNRKISLLTLCDLSKAFDSVNHNLLIKKCGKLGISSFWFNNYLSNRTQAVQLNNLTSDKEEVNFGVPQGSNSGPVLFTIYVNDLKDNLNDGTIIQYADDTQFLHSDSLNNLQLLINRTETSLREIQIYFLKNGLMLNPHKTQCIFIGNQQLISKIPSQTVIRLNETIINPSISVKNLGLHIDRYMLFDHHINEIHRKVMGILIYINRISSHIDKSSRIIAVQSLALNIIYYCIMIWGTTNNSLKIKMQRLQNFAARVAVGGLRKYDHVSPAFEELNWLKIDQKHEFLALCHIYKTLNNYYPEWLNSLRRVKDVTRGNTRQENDLHIARYNTNTGARSLKIHGPLLWNNLPTSLVNTNTLTSFKHLLAIHLSQN